MKVLRRTYFIYFLIPYKEVLWWDTPGWVGRVRVRVIGDTFHNKTIHYPLLKGSLQKITYYKNNVNYVQTKPLFPVNDILNQLIKFFVSKINFFKTNRRFKNIFIR